MKIHQKFPGEFTQKEDFLWTRPKVSMRSQPFFTPEVTYYVHEMSATKKVDLKIDEID